MQTLDDKGGKKKRSTAVLRVVLIRIYFLPGLSALQWIGSAGPLLQGHSDMHVFANKSTVKSKSIQQDELTRRFRALAVFSSRHTRRNIVFLNYFRQA